MKPDNRANKKLWDMWAHMHWSSAQYDIAGFRQRLDSLKPIEAGELPDVRGNTLLHLMCHLGLDTISLAHRGALATGVDFSPRSIEFATELSASVGVDVHFVCADVLDLPSKLSGTFDIVFTSYGILSWISDLSRWAQTIRHFMHSGARFYLVDHHPFTRLLLPRTRDDAGNALPVSYFPLESTLKVEEWGSYAVADGSKRGIAHYWNHTIGDVVTALAEAGLRIEFLHEFPPPSGTDLPDSPFRLDPSQIPYFFSLLACVRAA